MNKEKDNDTKESRPAAQAPLPGGDFRMFITKLSIQGLISLGIIENPFSKKTELNLNHAKALIDDLIMLKEKTQNNLDADEQVHINKVLADLQWQFVSLSSRSEDKL